MTRDILNRLIEDAEHGREGVLVTELRSGEQRMLDRGRARDGEPAALLDAAHEALLNDRCVTVEHDGGMFFLQPFLQRVRMIVVGAVHIAQPLTAMARLASWDVVVVDPRKAWATADRFPDVRMSTDWPDVALSALAPDHRTAVVTLTHDPKLDDPALSVALRSPAFYIGSLGSRKTHDARIRRLTEAGFNDRELARIHAPVGLEIGARTPAEIAVAILAQATQALRGCS